MNDNYENLKICKDAAIFCRYQPNPCCRYTKLKIEKPCGKLDCLYWNENYWSWEKPGILKFIVLSVLVLGFLENRCGSIDCRWLSRKILKISLIFGILRFSIWDLYGKRSWNLYFLLNIWRSYKIYWSRLACPLGIIN